MSRKEKVHAARRGIASLGLVLFGAAFGHLLTTSNTGLSAALFIMGAVFLAIGMIG